MYSVYAEHISKGSLDYLQPKQSMQEEKGTHEIHPPLLGYVISLATASGLHAQSYQEDSVHVCK